MPVITYPDSVEYLSFEGGGGAGAAYLGALKAFEELDILPLKKPANLTVRWAVTKYPNTI
ncbi:MAG TPA: hypothetical protein VK154_20160 [Chitinophagales bacterium]|nr:hypothetical protein [Chitinophagales bacterium]